MVELVCVPCALRADAVDAVFDYDDKNPLATRVCPKCASAATVATDVFKRFAAARATADKVKPIKTSPRELEHKPLSNDEVIARVERAAELDAADKTAKLLRDSHKWLRHVDAMRQFLLRGNSQLVQAASWWDGYHFYHERSWDAGESHVPDSLDYVTIVLVNKNNKFKEVLLYINPEDEGYAEVSSEQS